MNDGSVDIRFLVRWSVSAASLLILVAILSCGRKTDPLTPASPRPEAVKDIRIAVRDRIAYLSWPIPDKNVEGKPMGPADIAAFRIDRADLERDGKRPRFRELAEIDMADPASAVVRDGMISWSDPTLQYNRVYGYRIRAYGIRGGASPYSEMVRAVPLLSVATPNGLVAKAGDGVITLSWSPVRFRTDGSVHGGFVGYNIYRGAERGKHDDAPLNKEPVRTNTYVDRTVENGKAYYYHIRSVDSPLPSGKESLDSEEVSAVPMDMTPPEMPSGLTVVPGVGRVFLTWNENKEGDLAGYQVYRSTKSGGDAQRLTVSVIKRTTFSDTSVQQGMTYYYSITAVDKSGNESARSGERKTYTEKIR
jgi:hypothetical protein